jgi:hypothetical protein
VSKGAHADATREADRADYDKTDAAEEEKIMVSVK